MKVFNKSSALWDALFMVGAITGLNYFSAYSYLLGIPGSELYAFCYFFLLPIVFLVFATGRRGWDVEKAFEDLTIPVCFVVIIMTVTLMCIGISNFVLQHGLAAIDLRPTVKYTYDVLVGILQLLLIGILPIAIAGVISFLYVSAIFCFQKKSTK